MRDTDVVEAFRAGVTPPGTELRAEARARLLDSMAGARRPRRRRRRRVVVAIAALTVAAIALVVAPWQDGGPNDIARAAAMVALQPGTVLHVRAVGHDIYTPFSEQWIAPDGSWREQHGGANAAGACTVEAGFDARSHVSTTYDAPTNTIYSRTLSESQARMSLLSDQVEQVREWLAAGDLRVAGKTRVDGRRVTRLAPTHGKAFRGVIAYYVDARTSAPVRWQVNARQWYDYTIYERLPATAANTALTSLKAQHPTAAHRRGWGRPGGCASG